MSVLGAENQSPDIGRSHFTEWWGGVRIDNVEIGHNFELFMPGVWSRKSYGVIEASKPVEAAFPIRQIYDSN
jgi:hypothetical protein